MIIASDPHCLHLMLLGNRRMTVTWDYLIRHTRRYHAGEWGQWSDYGVRVLN